MTAKADRLAAEAKIRAEQQAEELAGVKTVLPCGQTIGVSQFLDIRVREVTGAPVVAARVDLASPGFPRWGLETDEDGDVVVNWVAGPWTACASAPWHLASPADQEGDLRAREIHIVHITLEELRFYLHVDADRDGLVDEAHQARDVLDRWTWGEAGKGAIVLCNNDCDTQHAPGLATRDNADDVVNGPGDWADVALFEIRAHGSLRRPAQAAGWTATLTIADAAKECVRIFDDMPVGRFMLGHRSADHAQMSSHAFSLHAALEKTVYGIEALRYADTGFDGLVRITLTVSNGGPAYFTDAEMRVAPWLMPNHLDDVTTVFVSNLGEDTPEVPTDSRDNKGNGTFRASLGAALNGCTLSAVSRPDGEVLMDAFVQDCMEIGYAVFPRQTDSGQGALQRLDTALQMAGHSEQTDLKWLARSLLSAGIGYQEFPGAAVRMKIQQEAIVAAWSAGCSADEAPKLAMAEALKASLERWGSVDLLTVQDVNAASPDIPEAVRSANLMSLIYDCDFHVQNSLNQGGNLECTPPVASATGQEYPWGRIYYNNSKPGKTISPDLAAFLHAQRVQHPFTLDGSWLRLGHVDEMVSFIPSPGGPWHKWCLLIASPKIAYDLLDRTPPDSVMLTGRVRNRKPLQMTTKEFVSLTTAVHEYGSGKSTVSVNGASLRSYNTSVQECLNGVLATLKREIGVGDDDVIQLPVIFAPTTGAEVENLKAEPLTGNLVNLLLANDECIMPCAFGPTSNGTDAFEDYARTTIASKNAALRMHFINNWYAYHCDGGSMHCGTQTHRRPRNPGAWLEACGKWWHYTPPGN